MLPNVKNGDVTEGIVQKVVKCFAYGNYGHMYVKVQ
jgi:hypothetical protein